MFYLFSGHWCRRRRYSSLCVLMVCLLYAQTATSAAQDSLTLVEATRRASANNPELQVFQWRSRAINAMQKTAELKPAYELGLEAENIGGSGDFSRFESAELTLSLSSVIELGGKRESRVTLADSRYALVQAEREAKALDLLGLVTQRFIAALSLQEKLEVLQEATQLAQQSLQLVSVRVRSGATPEAERLRAQVVLKKAQMQQEALSAELESRQYALASLWNADQADFNQVSGNLFHFEEPSNFESLYQRVVTSPAMQVFLSEERLRDAEVALARSQSAGNVQWRLGVRRFEDTGDSALTVGISVPLFSGNRNRGKVQSALAEREVIQYRREAEMLNIRARLFDAWQTYRQSAAAARQMSVEVLPLLKNALEHTRQAYERGRYSYVEWVSVQRELLDTRMAHIDAATTALLNQALIEQLTGEPLVSDGK